MRGVYVFESIGYLELRHTPYLRTDPALSELTASHRCGKWWR